MNKYLKYSLYILPLLIVLLYAIRTKVIQQGIIAHDIDHKIEPPHSHDFAYKQAYLAPVDKRDEICRANTNKASLCTSSCRSYQTSTFPKCVYSQPDYVVLDMEDGKESAISKLIKETKYF